MERRIFSKTSFTVTCAISLGLWAKVAYSQKYRKSQFVKENKPSGIFPLQRPCLAYRSIQCEKRSSNAFSTPGFSENIPCHLKDVQDRLVRFCEKNKIPHKFHPQVVPSENGKGCVVQLTLPEGLNVTNVINKVLDFRTTRYPWQRAAASSFRSCSQQRQFTQQPISDQEMRLRVTLNLDASLSPFIMDFFFPKNNRSNDTKRPPESWYPQRVDIYRENRTLKKDDVQTIKLFLSLAHNIPRCGETLVSQHDSREGHLPTSFFHGLESHDSSFFSPWIDRPFAHLNSFGVSHHPLSSIHRFFGGYPFMGDNQKMEEIHCPPWESENHNFFNFFNDRSASPGDLMFHSPMGDATPTRMPPRQQIKKCLDAMGVSVYFPSEKSNPKVDWRTLPGYDEAKRVIEETILLTFSHASEFEKLTEMTRSVKGDKNSPRMILFKGPPGTGKTTTSRLIATSTQLPLIYIPLEAFVSKWFGESEKNLGKIFDLAKLLGNHFHGCILFIDEIDSLASSRDNYNLHEVSKKILSILLRRLDGFDTHDDKILLICATNREKDLDEAFRSRIDVTVTFPLPSHHEREMILQRYAKHLSAQHVKHLASQTEGLSGRNIRDFCSRAERAWVAHLINEKKLPSTPETPLAPPPLEFYIQAAKEKAQQQA